MGTINYKTSNYITLGYCTNNIDYEDEFYYDDIEYEFEGINAILNDAAFYYFNVKLDPGYYEGFSIDIEYNFAYCLDNYIEKLEALKEITRIKNFMLYIVNNFNVCAVYPGWCTGYTDYNTTIKEINNAIKEMRAAVKDTPTYYKLKLAGEY